MTSLSQPPSRPPGQTFFSTIKQFFAELLSALAKLAEVMALWSWWRVLGLSVLLIASGAIIDDYVFSSTATTKVVTIDSGDVHATKAKKPEFDELDLPEDIQSGKVSIRIDKNGIKIDRIDKDGAPVATTPAADVLPEAESGKRGKVKIKIDTDNDSDGPSVFKFIAFLMCLTMWISKIVGGSRMREKAANVRANVATASLQSQSLERQIAEAKLLRMQAQVEPHFLFNTLAALERLIETNPTRALAMSQALSQWLRALLPQMKEGQSTLGQEITLVQNYLQLMQMRMGERLAYFIDVPETLRAEALPSMLLQPLVENSIKHGLEPKRAGGEVRIKARLANEFIELTVEDTGVGFSSNPGSGNGLTNLRERLELIYSGRAMVSVIARGTLSNDTNEGLTGTVITIKIPALKR